MKEEKKGSTVTEKGMRKKKVKTGKMCLALGSSANCTLDSKLLNWWVNKWWEYFDFSLPSDSWSPFCEREKNISPVM